MAENDQTKICPLCAETIKAAAKVCPYCRKNLRRGIYVDVFDAAALGTVAFFIGVIVLIYNIFAQGRGFSPVRHEIEVLSSQVAMGASSEHTNVFVSGILTNRSDYAWQNLKFEVRYFDQSGKMFDADSCDDHQEFTVLSHSDHSFSLNLWSRDSIPKYATYRVMVTSASDPRNWFPDDY